MSATDAATYSVVVSGVCGNAVTNSASLTVNQTVVVASAPVSVTTCPGTNASFSVNATGTGLSYQWYKDGSALAGQTGSSLVLSSVSAADAATYSVVVSDLCGNAVTNSASLTVNQNVVVVTGPVSVTNCPGSSASFSVSATGTGLSYQWYKNGNALAGQTGSSLVLSNVSATDAGTYSVVVSDVCGNAVTNSASLTVNQNVAVVSWPVSLTNCPGSSASFSVSATGTGLSYQWYLGGNALAGQTGSSLVLNSVSATDAGTYSVVVSGVCGSPVSQSASLTVNQNLAVASAPVSVTNCPGTSASFSVSATGTGLSYQWYNGTNGLAGQTNSSLVLSNVAAGDAGTYSVVVSGACGMAVTNSAEPDGQHGGGCQCVERRGELPWRGGDVQHDGYGHRAVQLPVVFGGQCAGGPDGQQFSAGGGERYGCRGLQCGGERGVRECDQQREPDCEPERGGGSGPVSVTNCPGTSASFSVSATGTGLSYQWYLGGNVLAGQTGSSLVLSSVSAADAGIYSVVVSGACGSVTNSASLTVNQNVAVVSCASERDQLSGGQRQLQRERDRHGPELPVV